MKDGLLILIAFVMGSIPFSYYVVRLVSGKDVRRLGSGNPGATNVYRTTGRGAGLAALVLDAGKGIAAVELARSWHASPAVLYAAGVAAVLGHLYPMFLGFKGGKGVATGLGVLIASAPLATLAAVVVFVVIVRATGFVAVGSVAAAALAVPAAWAFGRLGWTAPAPPSLLYALGAIALLIAWRHRENLRRLLRGEEARLHDPVRDEEGA